MSECNTHYIFEGNTYEIEELYKHILRLKDDKQISELVEILDCNNDEIDCEGNISGYDMITPLVIKVEVMTKHKENIEPFKAIMHLYPSLKCYFSAQNISIGYYVTNDYARKYFPERYIIEQGGEEPVYCKRKSNLFDEISEILSIKTDTMDKVVQRVAEYNKSHSLWEQIRLHEVQMADDLVNFRVKTIVQRMEMFVKDNLVLRNSESYYANLKLIADTNGELEFIWLLLAEETKLYVCNLRVDMEQCREDIKKFQEENISVSGFVHTNILTLSPRSLESIENLLNEML